MPVRRTKRYTSRWNQTRTRWNQNRTTRWNQTRTTQRQYGKPWTPFEVTTLRKIYRDTPTKDIARRFSRTISSVQAKAGDLGLKKSQNYMRKMRRNTWN